MWTRGTHSQRLSQHAVKLPRPTATGQAVRGPERPSPIDKKSAKSFQSRTTPSYQQLIGPNNEDTVDIHGQDCTALIDSGSHVDRNRRIPVRLCNITAKPITIRRNCKLAQVSSIIHVDNESLPMQPQDRRGLAETADSLHPTNLHPTNDLL